MVKDYIDFANKNKVVLQDLGKCQFCGANTKRAIHECMEIFNFKVQAIDFTSVENHKYKFFMVDAHALQHPEIHGRWSNHFHLARLHLIFRYRVEWSYELSPKLSNVLNVYKTGKENEYLIPPNVLERGEITSKNIVESKSERESKKKIEEWAKQVYDTWKTSYKTVDNIAKEFLK